MHSLAARGYQKELATNCSDNYINKFDQILCRPRHGFYSFSILIWHLQIFHLHKLNALK